MVTKLTLAYDGDGLRRLGAPARPAHRAGGARARAATVSAILAASRSRSRSPGAPTAACTRGGRSPATRHEARRPAAAERAARPTTSRCSRASRRRRVRRAPRRAQPHLLLPRARRRRCARPFERGRALGARRSSTATRSHACARALVGHARLHRVHPDRDRPRRASSATSCAARLGGARRRCSSSGSRPTPSCAR